MPFGGVLALKVKTVVVLHLVVSSNTLLPSNLTTSTIVSANITPIRGFTVTFVLIKSSEGHAVSEIERVRDISPDSLSLIIVLRI